MNKYGADIVKVVCTDFMVEGCVYVSEKEVYTHTLTYNTTKTGAISSTKVSLVSSSNSFKYPQKVISNVAGLITFEVDPLHHELALFDAIEVSLRYVDNSTLIFKSPCQRQLVTICHRSLQYTTGYIPLPKSNLLYPRIKLGFPQWGSIEKNDISNGSKLLEPLFTPFYDSYHKIISVNDHSLFKTPYKKYSSVFIGNPPLSVVKSKQGVTERLFETSCLQSSPLKGNLTSDVKSPVLSKLVLTPMSDTKSYDLTPFLDTTLYTKKLRWGTNSRGYVHIKGYDGNDDILEERVIITDDFFTMHTRKFRKITEIITNSNIELSNYVDCRFEHFFIRDPKTVAPIVDLSLYAFNPKVLKVRNKDDIRTVLNIHNIGRELSEVAYKFDIEQSQEITSLFLDNHLRVYWTDGVKMYSSLLGHDLSKDVGNDSSSNNNNVIKVSDRNTSIGDWVDISIDTYEWKPNTPMVIRVKNGDNILYYNQETEEFEEDVIFFYPKDVERFIELSLKVSNKDAYIFTVLDDTLTQTFSAFTHSNLIESVDNGTSCSGFLCIYDGDLRVFSGIPTGTIKAVNNSDTIYMTIKPNGINTFDWEYGALGYSISNKGNTLPEELFNTVSSSSDGNTPVVVDLDRVNILKHFGVDSLTTHLKLRINNVYNKKGSYSFTVTITDGLSTFSKDYSMVLDNEEVSEISIPVKFTRNTKELNNAS